MRPVKCVGWQKVVGCACVWSKCMNSGKKSNGVDKGRQCHNYAGRYIQRSLELTESKSHDICNKACLLDNFNMSKNVNVELYSMFFF